MVYTSFCGFFFSVHTVIEFVFAIKNNTIFLFLLKKIQIDYIIFQFKLKLKLSNLNEVVNKMRCAFKW